MKKTITYSLFCSLIWIATASGGPEIAVREVAKPGFDGASRFIFYSVLEGLYEDGVTDESADQMLMRRDGESYYHFVYACPVCTPTIWALEAYRIRPERLYGVKGGKSTFGGGLGGGVHDHLHSDDPKRRLSAINALINRWISARMDRMGLKGEEREEMVRELEKKRERGMELLESFREPDRPKGGDVAALAPAFVDIKGCAACNGAVGKPMGFNEEEKE